MKKLLLFFALLATLIGYSQTVSGYLKQQNFKAHRYHGFRSCYDSIIVDLQLDSNQCFYLGNGAIFQGNSYNNNEIVIKCPEEPLTRYEWDWAAYDQKYSSTEQDIFDPYKRNANGYASASSVGSKADKSTTLTINGVGYDLSANRSWTISATETDPNVPSYVKSITTTEKSNWNTAYSWGDHSGLYRPISYVPAWTDITGKPTFKRQETYSGTTNASGVYTVTFGTAYSVAPNIQANIVGGTNTNLIKITSVSTTGFTATVVNRVDVVGLLPSYTNVNGAAVDVLITEK